MKACLICPIPNLEELVPEDSTMHLTLAHLAQLHPEYRAFYKKRSEAGDFVILDNGAKENGIGMPMDALLYLGDAMGIQELVAPDVRYQWQDTVKASVAGIDALVASSHLHNDIGDLARRVQVMLVAQGSSPYEVLRCLADLVNYAQFKLGGSRLTISVPYHYDHLFVDGIVPLLEEAKEYGLPIHLLGWPRNLRTLERISELGLPIRSTDSSRAFVYGKHGLPCFDDDGDQVEYPSRDALFFTEPIPEEHHQQVLDNIALYRKFADEVV